MSGINGDVRDIVNELDADGSGYQTREAANLLVSRYVDAGICDDWGDPKPKVRTLMRMGASVAFKNYKSDGKAEERKHERAFSFAGGEQRDFAEDHDDFGFEWLRVYAAWDEGETAERKMLVRMTLYEVLDVIALKRKKAAEATAVANLLQDIIDEHPGWYDHPELTVADILDIRE
ncbi:MAG TPA: hypothetical protein VL614_03370 [Acetobacteraceae bacterium]|jgi:hypothetical protein|nr:hypothetical protein [Acetobacteraceae bacterium]